ncbi:hypothetical protein LTS09_006608 [Friedmanniomyces endolithicus]|nr:hypothetical protein LTS09_006608 [Friedmanniomyces endolithicus]
MQGQQPTDPRKDKPSDESTAAASSANAETPRSTASTTASAAIEVPCEAGSLNTLLFLRVDLERTVNQDDFKVDFGKFTKTALRHLVEYEGCDTDEPDIDWSDDIREIGANEPLVKALAQRGEYYDVVRLRHSAAQWADMSIEARWERLLSSAEVIRPLTEGTESAQGAES